MVFTGFEVENTLNVIAKVLLVRENYAVALISTPGYEGQLVFLPTIMHENDFIAQYDYYQRISFKKMKVAVYR